MSINYYAIVAINRSAGGRRAHFVWNEPRRKEHENNGVYREIAPPERLVFSEI
ncbi:MAG: SRPBCC domain-containing protein [Alphaproteobacteria bacterium]|nr:SRPBCC domain-containing protein [Alphaproteobacteria bacterium]